MVNNKEWRLFLSLMSTARQQLQLDGSSLARVHDGSSDVFLFLFWGGGTARATVQGADTSQAFFRSLHVLDTRVTKIKLQSPIVSNVQRHFLIDRVRLQGAFLMQIAAIYDKV